MLSVRSDEDFNCRIDDRKLTNPRMRSMTQAITIITRERGFGDLMQGLVPTSAKQAANSAVRFTSYSKIRQMVQQGAPEGQKLDGKITVAIGGAAGAITVFATQPIDTVKTRMQSLDAKKQYKHSLDAAIQIVRDGEVTALWAGAVPRLARLMVSSPELYLLHQKSGLLMMNIIGS